MSKVVFSLSNNINQVTYNADHIKHYTNFNWQKVCTVSDGGSGTWHYKNIDKTLMYSNHRSWVYAITVGDYIVKIGETSQPLGIARSYGDQPITGTKSRLGRYANQRAAAHGREADTDETIRDALYETVKTPTMEVAFYAFKCPETSVKIDVVNDTLYCKAQIHKQLEKLLLDYYKENVGSYPDLNSGRA